VLAVKQYAVGELLEAGEKSVGQSQRVQKIASEQYAVMLRVNDGLHGLTPLSFNIIIDEKCETYKAFV
jgi:hypothetical protein